MKRYLTILASTFSFIALLMSCAPQQPSETEETQTPEVTESTESAAAGQDDRMAEKIWNTGENFFAGGLKWNVVGVKTNARFKGKGTTSTSLSGADAAQEGGTADAILVSVSVENPDDKPKSVDPSMFRLEDNQGNVVQPNLNGAALFNMKDFPVFDKALTVESKAAPAIITLVFEIQTSATYDLLIQAGTSTPAKVRMDW
jgi:hypothetical protein